MFSESDLRLINQQMSITTFDALPGDERVRLLKKWHKESTVLTARDIPFLHNDGDVVLVEGKDF